MRLTSLTLVPVALLLAASGAVVSGQGQPGQPGECSLFLAVLVEGEESTSGSRMELAGRSVGGVVNCGDGNSPLDGSVVLTHTATLDLGRGRDQGPFTGEFAGELLVVESGLTAEVRGEVTGEIRDGAIVSETLRGRWQAEHRGARTEGTLTVGMVRGLEDDPDTLGGSGSLTIEPAADLEPETPVPPMMGPPEPEGETADPPTPEPSPDPELITTARCEDRGNVTIEAGQTCEFTGTSLRGNVRIREGGRLVLHNTRVAGNVRADGASGIEMSDSRVDGNLRVGEAARVSIASSTIRGNVTIEGAGELDLRGSSVNGNVRLEEGGTVTLRDNTIRGNVRLEDNRAAEVSGNRVSGNLRCRDNRALTGDGNTVSGNSRDQCAGL